MNLSPTMANSASTSIDTSPNDVVSTATHGEGTVGVFTADIARWKGDIRSFCDEVLAELNDVMASLEGHETPRSTEHARCEVDEREVPARRPTPVCSDRRTPFATHDASPANARHGARPECAGRPIDEPPSRSPRDDGTPDFEDRLANLRRQLAERLQQTPDGNTARGARS